MAGMIPCPAIDYFPVSMDKTAAEGVALGRKIDEIFCSGFFDDIVFSLKNCNPFMCRDELIDTLGQWIAAGIQQFDSEYTKRNLIATAITRHKNSGRWDEDYKKLIDSITGLDAEIVRAIDSADWIWMGGESSEPDYYWATMGADGVDDALGIDLIGDGTEVEIAGNLYIDLGGDAANPDAATLEKLIASLVIDGLPAYFTLYLGYRTGTMFTVYTGGVV